jgi:uncharacterized damage-inducible protein DinB
MPADRSFVAENNAERVRLRALVSRLSDADLALPMPGGWTVASVLGHVAFWDQRILVLLESLERSGPAPEMNEADVDWINDAAKPMLLALPPRRAAELTVAIAEAVDRKVEALPDDFVARSASKNPINLLRAEHRREHLDEIEQALRR